MFADIELRWAHEVADVLDHDEVEVGERQARQGGTNHRCVEMAFPTETVRRVDQRHRCAQPCEPIGIDRRLDIALDDANAHRRPELQQHLAEQRGLACSGRRHQVDDLNVGVVKIVAIGLGGAVVLAEDPLQHVHTQATGLVTAVITHTAVIMQVIMVMHMAVLAVFVPVVTIGTVVRMCGSISVIVEASHGWSSNRLTRTLPRMGDTGTTDQPGCLAIRSANCSRKTRRDAASPVRRPTRAAPV